MKKLLLVIAMVAFAFTAKAQEGQFNLGANVGLPIGGAGDVYSFAVGAEVNYLFEISDEFKLGPSVAFQQFFGKDRTIAGVSISGTNVSILPITAASRYSVSDEFVLGADLGVAIGLSNASGSGFYYRPLVGYNVSEKVMIQASFNGTDGFNSIGLGAMFSL